MDSQQAIRQQFDVWIQEILNHLYDSLYLQSHPLVEQVFAHITDAPECSRSLRKAVLSAIDAICPGAAAPAQSPDWRAYRILELRYVEGRQTNEIMEELGLGRSQYYREQARALEAVTVLLWAKWEARLTHQQLPDSTYTTAPAAQPSQSKPDSTAMASTREEVAHQEAARLCAEAHWQEIEVSALLQTLAPVLRSLAAARDAAIDWKPLGAITIPKADRVVLRQALLNVITYGVDSAQGGQVEIGPLTGARRRGLYVVARPHALAPLVEAAPRQGVGLEISQQLMIAMEGTLHIEQAVDQWRASFIWPVASAATLLVIDDNSMIDDLFRRYLAETGWQVVGVTNGDDARRAIDRERPRVILLDIMMPKVDGWEILSRLTGNPETRDIPVIICSVLNEPALATLLGAAAYLEKPVSRQQLLQALRPYRTHVQERIDATGQ